MSDEALCGVYIDMGTTHTRVWLMRGTEVLAFARAQVGVADSARDGSTEKISSGLKRLIAEACESRNGAFEKPAFCIASGMISSSLGLMEVPHVAAPAGEAELSAALQVGRFPDITKLPFILVPGVRINGGNPAQPPMQMDMMRGEETLCIGLLRNGIFKPGSTLLNLGSHWKAISLDGNGRVVSSVSSLAGELLHAAQTQTILAGSLPQTWPEELDPEWVEAGMNEQGKSGLARALYCVRMLHQNLKTPPEKCFAFLCGAFIRADLEKLLSRQILSPGSRVLIAAGRPLGTAWQHALGQNRIPSTLLTTDERERALLTGLRIFAASLPLWPCDPTDE